MTSVSVSVSNLAPAASSSSRSSRKFSMMPLWTSATLLGRVRVGVALGRRAVGRPARVADADVAGQRLAGELLLEIAELALRAPAGQVAAAPASPRRPNRSRGTPAASAHRPAAAPPAPGRGCRRCRTSAELPDSRAAPDHLAVPAHVLEITSCFAAVIRQQAPRRPISAEAWLIPVAEFSGTFFRSGFQRRASSRGICAPSRACPPAGRARRPAHRARRPG